MMTPEHPRWAEFTDRLTGPEGCNFRVEKKTTVWDCAGRFDKSKAQAILQSMGLSNADVNASLTFFERHGGHCDCEILFNVARSRREKP